MAVSRAAMRGQIASGLNRSATRARAAAAMARSLAGRAAADWVSASCTSLARHVATLYGRAATDPARCCVGAGVCVSAITKATSGSM